MLRMLERHAAAGLCAGLFALPLFHIKGRLVTLAASDLVLPVVLLMATAALLTRGLPSANMTLPSWQTLLPFLLWFVWLALSAGAAVRFDVRAIDPYVLKKLLGFVVLGAYFAAGYWVATRMPYDVIVKILLVAGTVGTIIGIGRLFLLPFDIGYASLPYGYRLLGMTHNPNLFGLQQGAIIAMAITWLKPEKAEWRWTAWPSGRELLIASTLAGLWLSGSRTAIFAIALVFLTSLLLGRSAFVSLVRCLVLSSVIAAVGFGLFSLYRALIQSSGGSVPLLISFLQTTSNVGLLTAVEPQGVDHRSYIHQRAAELFLQHPWIGVGLGQFYMGFQRSGDPMAGEIHSSYLWMLTELGVIGFLIALWAALHFAIRAVQSVYQARWLNPLALLVFYGVAALGADVVFQRPLYFFAGILVALLSSGPIGKAGTGLPSTEATRA